MSFAGIILLLLQMKSNHVGRYWSNVAEDSHFMVDFGIDLTTKPKHKSVAQHPEATVSTWRWRQLCPPSPTLRLQPRLCARAEGGGLRTLLIDSRVDESWVSPRQWGGVKREIERESRGERERRRECVIFPVSVSKGCYWHRSRSGTLLYRDFEVRGRQPRKER